MKPWSSGLSSWSKGRLEGRHRSGTQPRKSRERSRPELDRERGWPAGGLHWGLRRIRHPLAPAPPLRVAAPMVGGDGGLEMVLSEKSLA